MVTLLVETQSIFFFPKRHKCSKIPHDISCFLSLKPNITLSRSQNVCTHCVKSKFRLNTSHPIPPQKSNNAYRNRFLFQFKLVHLHPYSAPSQFSIIASTVLEQVSQQQYWLGRSIRLSPSSSDYRASTREVIKWPTFDDATGIVVN